MLENVLVIGGHGNLGRPVVRRLVNSGFNVRVLARDVKKAKSLLPDEVEIVEGDLSDINSLKTAADDMEAIYLNLSTPDSKAEFRPELDGTLNVIEATKDEPGILLSKISGLNARHTGYYLDRDQKFAADEAIIKSGHPYLIFRPTWFFESFPMFLRNGKLMKIGRSKVGPHWLAADDYGKWIAKSYKEGLKNKILYMQGKKSMCMDEVFNEMIRIYNPKIKSISTPLFVIRIIGNFNQPMLDLYYLMKETQLKKEEFKSKETWELLGEPEMEIADYIKYAIRHGDLPEI